jgi:hypothetical protein
MPICGSSIPQYGATDQASDLFRGERETDIERARILRSRDTIV